MLKYYQNRRPSGEEKEQNVGLCLCLSSLNIRWETFDDCQSQRTTRSDCGWLVYSTLRNWHVEMKKSPQRFFQHSTEYVKEISINSPIPTHLKWNLEKNPKILIYFLYEPFFHVEYDKNTLKNYRPTGGAIITHLLTLSGIYLAGSRAPSGGAKIPIYLSDYVTRWVLQLYCYTWPPSGAREGAIIHFVFNTFSDYCLSRAPWWG